MPSDKPVLPDDIFTVPKDKMPMHWKENLFPTPHRRRGGHIYRLQFQ